MGCTDFIVKYALFLVNFVIFFIGLTLVLTTIASILYTKALAELVDNVDYFPERAILFGTVGTIIFIVSFMGCCGAIAEKPYLLNMYAIVMLLLSGVMMYIMIFFYALLRDLQQIFASMQRVEELPLTRTVLRVIEATIPCCGILGPVSYEVYGLELPATCCPGLIFPPFKDIYSIIEINNILSSYNKTEYYCVKETSYDGCASVITDLLMSLYNLANNITILVLVVEVIAAIFAFYLAQHIRNEIDAKNSSKSYTLQAKS
ncbi:unnamed protein product [Chilo suppressalis]|uniref:Tetraspanin n=1 Tax=Chilo suppressalis TaxID=168631 RepID=A0ABN8AXJ3_CHISP|nr:hypothetical protein evm_002928 [Chilo suppressalis]CAH0397539.1 unnamed protein product [Chilo suppressalis]